MAPPPLLEPQYDICMQRCNPVTTANCVKCKNVDVHHACLGITSCSNLPATIFWSWKICSTNLLLIYQPLIEYQLWRRKKNASIHESEMSLCFEGKWRRLENQFLFSWMRKKLDFTEIELRALQALKAFRAAKKEKLKNSLGNLQNEN